MLSSFCLVIIFIKRIIDSLENSAPLFTLGSGNLLTLFSAFKQFIHNWIGFALSFGDSGKERMFTQFRGHPIVQVWHVRDGVNLSSNTQGKSVFCQEGFVDNPPLVLGFFEVRIRKQKEHLFQLAFSEEVG